MSKSVSFLVFFLFCLFILGKSWPVEKGLAPVILEYGEEFYNYSKKQQCSTAVLVVAFNRPHYLEQSIESIEKNKESNTLPFFFFLDGGNGAMQEENIKIIQNSSIANKYIIVREINYGIPKNHIDAKRFLFDFCGFEKIVVFEEDVIISSNYFETLLKLDDFLHSKYINIGTVQLWVECLLSPQEKRNKLALLQEARPIWSLVTYCMHKKVWDDIAPILYEYEQKFIDPVLGDDCYAMARSKPTRGPFFEKIVEWAHLQLHQNRRKNCLLNFKRRGTVLPSSLTEIANPALVGNQDMTTCFAMWIKGYTRVQTVVNRVIHIGQEGFLIKSRPIHLQMKLDEFEEVNW
jgi:hypothetical protein